MLPSGQRCTSSARSTTPATTSTVPSTVSVQPMPAALRAAERLGVAPGRAAAPLPRMPGRPPRPSGGAAGGDELALARGLAGSASRAGTSRAR